MESKTKILKIKRARSDVIVLVILSVIAFVFMIAFAFPVFQVIASSFLVGNANSVLGVTFSLDGYKAILENSAVLQGFANSVLYTTVGTLFSVIVTVLSSYVISRPEFRMGKVVTFLFVATNYFSGGFIPTYLLVKNLGLLNSMWALILPSAVSVYNVLMLQSYFKKEVPSELYDAARMDGCGHWGYLLRIVLPMTKSFVALIGFFYAVSYWNSYFNASIYITDADKLPLPNILKELLLTNQESLIMQGGTLTEGGITAVQQSRLLEHALIVVAAAPMIILLFFIRKSFKNGNSTGGVVM